MAKAKRAYQSDQLRTSFRGWRLIITRKACTGIKGKKTFELDRFTSFDEAMRAGKARVNELEGAEVWNQAYENEALK